MPGGRKEHKLCEAKTIGTSFMNSPEVELKDLPHIIEYAFLEATQVALILMEEDYAQQSNIKEGVNPKIHDVTKKEVEKLLEAGLIYPISDSPWVSPVHCVPKKGGITVVVNEENELIPTRLVTDGGICSDYRKLNEAHPSPRPGP
ncbi:hypothetical protein Tco_0452349 [Tanacetum coccineum]